MENPEQQEENQNQNDDSKAENGDAGTGNNTGTGNDTGTENGGETGTGTGGDDKNQNKSSAPFQPLLYNFRVLPPPAGSNTMSLQQPFATLFDNLITVLWGVYGTDSKIQIGIHQMQWALEFLKVMKIDYRYPESIGLIVNELEKQLIDLYAKVGEKLQEIKRKQEEEQKKKEEEEKKGEKSEVNEDDCEKYGTSYNENDVMDKLNKIKNIPVDSTTGEAKYLKELNAMGRRKIVPEPCRINNKASKTYMIDKLQQILKNTSEEGTKTEVEELIKGLKVQNSSTTGSDKNDDKKKKKDDSEKNKKESNNDQKKVEDKNEKDEENNGENKNEESGQNEENNGENKNDEEAKA